MFKTDLLKGKRALITGGGTGLGKSIGKRYLELGAELRLYPPGSQVEPQEMGVPLRRFGTHSELANLFAYLAADEAGYISGDLIVIDGGRWMQGIGGSA